MVLAATVGRFWGFFRFLTIFEGVEVAAEARRSSVHVKSGGEFIRYV